jgi:hypothetical protein
MQDFQKRVVEERDQLSTRLDSLNGFVVGKVFASLPIAKQTRLRDQATHMRGYLSVLNSRINNFTDE